MWSTVVECHWYHLCACCIPRAKGVAKRGRTRPYSHCGMASRDPILFNASSPFLITHPVPYHLVVVLLPFLSTLLFKLVASSLARRLFWLEPRGTRTYWYCCSYRSSSSSRSASPRCLKIPGRVLSACGGRYRRQASQRSESAFLQPIRTIRCPSIQPALRTVCPQSAGHGTLAFGSTWV